MKPMMNFKVLFRIPGDHHEQAERAPDVHRGHAGRRKSRVLHLRAPLPVPASNAHALAGLLPGTNQDVGLSVA